ncbi:MAG TPA: hypothetical protein PLA19_00780 [Candidatus Pacearchaeota archaeon]|jgi:hypothetical protein|nr:hypothetical protein [Candidatus Pacearchaeota archaeon]
MNELEKAIVEGFIRDNPVRMEMHAPILCVSLNDLREAVCSARIDEEKFLLIAVAIATDNGCFFNPCGSKIMIIVRHPRDIRLEAKIDVQKIFGSIKTAQKKIYELFAPVLVGAIYDELWELDNDELLLPALVDMGLISKL